MSDPAAGWPTLNFPFSGSGFARLRPGPSPDSPLVVLCHGMGETPERFLRAWRETLALPVHVVAPAGPYPFEIRKGEDIRIGFAWYLYDGGTEWFRESLDRSADWLAALVRSVESRRGWTPSRRALVGFSQGAYFGYVAALGNQDLFDRLAAVGGRLKTEFVAEALAGGGPLEALVLHGSEDEAVTPEAAARSAEALERAGYGVTRALLPGGHALTPETDRRVAAWLAQGWDLGPSSG